MHQVNDSIRGGASDAMTFIGLLDVFGFEIFEVNSFEQLCINFANEKLHQFFLKFVFKMEEQIYTEECIRGIRIDYADNQPCIELVEKPPLGIFRLLDSQCKTPKASTRPHAPCPNPSLHPNLHPCIPCTPYTSPPPLYPHRPLIPPHPTPHLRRRTSSSARRSTRATVRTLTWWCPRGGRARTSSSRCAPLLRGGMWSTGTPTMLTPLTPPTLQCTGAPLCGGRRL